MKVRGRGVRSWWRHFLFRGVELWWRTITQGEGGKNGDFWMTSLVNDPWRRYRRDKLFQETYLLKNIIQWGIINARYIRSRATIRLSQFKSWSYYVWDYVDFFHSIQNKPPSALFIEHRLSRFLLNMQFKSILNQTHEIVSDFVYRKISIILTFKCYKIKHPIKTDRKS